MDYEDELDRMRARKKRTSRSEMGNRSAYNRIYDTPEPGRNPRASYSRNLQAADAHWQNNRNSPDDSMRRQPDPKQNHVRKSLGQNRLRKKRKRRRLLIIEFLILIVLLSGVWMMFHKGTNQEGYWTIAVFGVDSRDGRLDKGALADVEMICSIDKATGEIKLVSVYRDSYVKIDDKGSYHKINEAYFKGGHEQAISALRDNLDINVDNYATFNWSSVADAINLLGGIDLDITEAEFAYINGFITETVKSTGIGSHHLKSAGPNHLDGVQAVAYARLRLMDTDFNRTERQRKVVSLALEKAKHADFATRKTLVLTVMRQISTDIGLDDVLSMAKGINKYHLGETAGFPFSRTTMKIGKLDCVIATTLESNVIQLHQFLYNNSEYSPSASVRSISAKISEVSGISEPGKNAPTGGGSKGGSGDNSKSKGQAAPKETEAATTKVVVTEESSEPSTEEHSKAPEETTEEASIQEREELPTNDDGSLIGPGAGMNELESSDQETEKSEKPPAESPGQDQPVPKDPDNSPESSSDAPQNPPDTIEEPGEVGPGV